MGKKKEGREEVEEKEGGREEEKRKDRSLQYLVLRVGVCSLVFRRPVVIKVA